MLNWSLALGNRAIDAAGQGDSVLIVLRLQGGK
jgi:hypothetical protein